MQPETRLKNRIRPYLESIPSSWWVKVQQVALRGTPDFIGCVKGWAVAIELKKDRKEKPDALQTYSLDQMTKAGGYSFLIHKDNWQECIKFLKELPHKERPHAPHSLRDAS